MVAIGHGIVEIPLMILIFWGIGSLLESVILRVSVGFAGGLYVVWMGIGLLRDIDQSKAGPSKDSHSPFLSGIFFSIGNPYFLIWWATVGAALIMRSFAFGVFGFIAFALCHWFCDLGWNTILSFASFKGRQLFGHKFQQVVFIISGMLLLFVGGRMIFDAFLLIFHL
jgi:threonine/homoserine/homoserine lactone efflux protein